MSALRFCALLFTLAQLTFAQHVIQFELAAFDVPEDNTQVEIAVELLSVNGGGSRLDGEVIMARISTADLTATAPVDYAAQSNVRVMFTDGTAAGSLQTVTLTTINEDTLVEGDESFVAVLQPSNTGLGDTNNFVLGSLPSSTITILDDDFNIPITIGLSSLTLQEGESGQVCASISSGSTSGRTFVINYQTTDGNALQAAGDYQGTSGTLIFSDASGNVPQCFTVQTLDDSTNEGIECFNAQISSSPQDGLTLSPPTVLVCIFDDDPARVVSVFPAAPFSGFNFNEDAGSPQICVQVDNVVVPFSINYRSQDFSPPQAQGGSDYNALSGSFAFSSTATTSCVSLPIIDDSITENTECFNFILESTNAVSISPTFQTTQICIIDNDNVDRVFGFQQTEYFVDENVSPTAGFQVCVLLRQGQLAANDLVILQIRLVQGPGGTATEGEDYEPLSPDPFPVLFNPVNQDQLMCAPITIINDLVYEGDETFYAVVEDTASSNIPLTLSPVRARITIREDDPMPELPTFGTVGDDPHFAIFLPSGKLLCYTVQGEHSFAFNLISNDMVHMNALFVPDSHRDEVTWIGSLGIVVQNTHFQGSNTTRLRFDSKINQIHINDKVTLEAKNIDSITFRDGKLIISEGPIIESFHYPSVRVNLDDLGMQFTVNFTGEHLDMMWNKLEENHHSHGLIGQFFRKGVEIDVARKLLMLPHKAPVPVMRKPVWAYMEHNVPSDQLCWVAMNPGYQGNHLIDGHYLDYVVDNVLSTDFKFECKHKK